MAKHRNGPTANIEVVFQGHYSRFGDMARDAPEPFNATEVTSDRDFE